MLSELLQQTVGADIKDFEYTPKPEFKGNFTVWNVANEVRLVWVTRKPTFQQRSKPAFFFLPSLSCLGSGLTT